MGQTEYWSHHNVTLHTQFRTREESLEFLEWRNGQYLFYDDFFDFESLRGKSILDYGCGPGHDLVAMAERAAPARLIGADISAPSLAEAGARLRLHDTNVELLQLDADRAAIPLDDASVDFFLSSGVLHHCENAVEIMHELHRVLRPGGTGLVMVYNYDSLFVHLCVPYVRQIVESIDAELPLEEAFRRSTDWGDCPHSIWYTPETFSRMASSAGFDAHFDGAAVSAFELGVIGQRFDALRCLELAPEHGRFLRELTIDEHGRALHRGNVAGIDGFYTLKKHADSG